MSGDVTGREDRTLAEVAEVLHDEACRNNPGHASWTGCATSGPCRVDAAALAPLLARVKREAAAEAVRTAQQVLAGEDTVEWARGAKGSSLSLPYAIDALDSLIEDIEGAIDE